MPIRLKTLSRLFLLIFVLLVPVFFLYGYANWESIRVVKEQVLSSNSNRLQFFRSQIDGNINQIVNNVFSLMLDPDVKQFSNSYSLDDLKYENVAALNRIRSKLTHLNTASGWITYVSIYSPTVKRLINSSDLSLSNIELLPPPEDQGIKWAYKPDKSMSKSVFTTTLVDPFSRIKRGNDAALFEVQFQAHNFTKMLDSFKNEGRNDPFLYHPSGQHISNSTAEEKLVATVTAHLDSQTLLNSQYKTITINHEEYLLSYIKSDLLDWYLVDYEPLGPLVKPIMMSRTIFFITASCLGAVLLFLAITLYRQVRLPIKKLIISSTQLRNGDYSSRIEGKHNNEFDFLNYRFNEMASEIQHLIENVYKEKLRSQTASLKQLQSQINPHFLYNCLHFISIMNYRGNREAIDAMVTNLGEYYRYTTRLEHTASTLREEIQVLQNYLEIHRIRMPSLTYTLDISDDVNNVPVPRLILQPIIENSIVHGFAQKSGPLWIRIASYVNGNRLQLVIEDNGSGLTEQELDKLRLSLSQPPEVHEGGIGIWNVHQRLLLQYGSSAGLELFHSPSGGLKTQINIIFSEHKE
ncbi:sensor histidine kinase [Paenibacillus sp. IITD108]|uniref:sensor histidine kinase n=1 Tax=Paenibacillus sp. IITD108 TaxID=3116649 RepID=UPI002F40ECD1